MKIIYLLFLILFTIQLRAQSTGDWIWYEPDVFGSSVDEIEQGINGEIWMASGSKVIKFDGVNWIAFDVLDSGLPMTNVYIRSIDASLGNVLWISTTNRVFKYNLATNQWNIHDPTNGSVNVNGFNIKVESENRIWWTTGFRLREYNDTIWTAHHFYGTGLDINANSPREIVIDNNNQKWITTSSSICVDGGGCFTPAGVIRLSDTDTTFFDGEHYGFPTAFVSHIDLDSNDDPFFVFTEFSTNENFYMTYTNDQWSAPVEIPFNGNVYHMRLGSQDQIYLVFSNFIAIGEDGNWTVIPIDTSKITSVASFLLTPEDDIYIAGRHGNTSATYEGVVGYLPHLNYRARGLIYSDRNLNGTFDAFDQTLKDHFVRTVNGDRVSFSNNEGAYGMLFADPGDYGIEGILPLYHSYGLPDNGIHHAFLSLDNPTSENKDFGYYPDTTATDLSIAMTALNGANPGFQTCYMISVKNNAPRITRGEVTAIFDDLLTFESSDVLPSSFNGNQLTFDLGEMDWLEIKNIQACFSLPPDPQLMGDTLKNIGSAVPNGGIDLTPANNTDTICHVITGPYDPNFIAVRPTGDGTAGNIPVSTQKLEYTVHFQNIGTDTARNVVISNPIDTNLDVLSLNVIGYSHAFDLSFIEEGRILRWSFNDIDLPDSTSNLLESNGFIKYVINLKTQDIGTVFTNRADIFFDFNLPITTNTTINTLAEEVVNVFDIPGVKRCDYEVKVIENNLLLHFPEVNKYKIAIYDMNGRRLFASLVHHKDAGIAIDNLPTGIYVVSVASERCSGAKTFFVK